MCRVISSAEGGSFSADNKKFDKIRAYGDVFSFEENTFKVYRQPGHFGPCSQIAAQRKASFSEIIFDMQPILPAPI
jgi:hypothetical protein